MSYDAINVVRKLWGFLEARNAAFVNGGGDPKCSYESGQKSCRKIGQKTRNYVAGWACYFLKNLLLCPPKWRAYNGLVPWNLLFVVCYGQAHQGYCPLVFGGSFQGGFNGIFDSLNLFMCRHLLLISERLFKEELSANAMITFSVRHRSQNFIPF